MYEPFEQAIDRFIESEHVQPLAVYESRLSECDGCKYRREMTCKVCGDCGRKSLIRWAQKLHSYCPKGAW